MYTNPFRSDRFSKPFREDFLRFFKLAKKCRENTPDKLGAGIDTELFPDDFEVVAARQQFAVHTAAFRFRIHANAVNVLRG